MATEAELKQQEIEQLEALLAANKKNKKVADALTASIDRAKSELLAMSDNLVKIGKNLDKTDISFKEQVKSGKDYLKTLKDQIEYAKRTSVTSEDYNQKIQELTKKLDDNVKDPTLKTNLINQINITRKNVDSQAAWSEKLEIASKTLGELKSAAGNIVSSYQSGSGQIGTSSAVLQGGISVAGAGISAVGGVASSTGQALTTFGKGPVKIAGFALQGLGAVANLTGSALSATAKTVLPVLSAEINKAIGNFQSISSTGAVFAGGLGEMIDVAGNAGYSLEGFDKVLSANKERFAQSGLDMTEASKKFATVSKDMIDKGFRKDLLNLGYTLEEQGGLVADVFTNLQRTGRLESASTEEISKRTKDYGENLRTISAITGQDAKSKMAAAQKDMEALDVQAKLLKMQKEQPEVYDKVQAMLADMPEQMKAGFLQQFTGGVITDPATRVLMSRVPELQQGFDQLVAIANDSAVDAKQAVGETNKSLNTVREGFITNADALGQLGVAARLGVKGIAADAASMGGKLGGSLINYGKKVDEQGKTVDSAASTQDKQTESMNALIISNNELNIAMQKTITSSGILTTYQKLAKMATDELIGAFNLLSDELKGGKVSSILSSMWDNAGTLLETALTASTLWKMFKGRGGGRGGGSGGPHTPGGGGGGGGRMSRMWESSTNFLKDGIGKITGVFTGGAAKIAAGFTGITGAIAAKGGAMAEGIAKAAGAAVEGIKSFGSGMISGAEKAFTFIESGASSIATKLGSIAEGTASAFKTGISLIGSNLESAGTFIKTGATTLGNTIVNAATDGATFISNGFGKAAGFIESTASSVGTKLASAAETGASMLGTGISRAAGFVEASAGAIGSGIANTAETLKNGATLLSDNISTLAKQGASVLESAFGATTNALKTGADAVATKFGTIAESVSSISSGLANVAKESASQLGTVLSDATSILKTGAGTIGTKLAEAAESSAGFLKGSVSTIGSSLSGATDFLSSAVKAGANNLTSSLTSFSESALGSLKSITGSLGTALSDAGSFLSNGASKVGSAFESAGSFIKSSASTVVEKVSTVGAKAASLVSGATGAAGAAGAGASTAAKVGGAAIKGVASFGAKTVLKQLPLIGFGMGLWDAAERISKGDYAGAAMAAGAGAATFLPGGGTLASMALTGALAASDALGATGGESSAKPLEDAQPPVEGKPAEPAINANTPVQATPVEPTVNATIPQVNNTVEQNTNDLNTANAAREAEKAVEQAKAIAANAELTKAMIPDSNKPDLTEMLTAQVKQMVALLEELNDNTRSVSTNTRNTYHAVI
jgi:hypothetical protein